MIFKRKTAAPVEILRHRFEREVRTLTSRAGSEPVQQSDIEQLDALQRLLSYAEGLRRRKDFIVPAAIFLSLLSLVSTALFLHVRRCEVELDLTATRLGFQLDREQALFRPLPLGRLELRNAELEIFPDVVSGAYSSLHPLPGSGGKITLGTLLLPAGTKIDFDGCTQASWCEVRLSGKEIQLTGSVKGQMLLEGPGDTKLLNYPAAHNIRITGRLPEFFIAPQLSDGAKWPALTNVHVHGFTLETVSEHPTVGAAYARSVSTLRNGKILFSDLTDVSRNLRRRERLDIDFDGWIDELDFSESSLRVFASGTVRKLESVNGETRHNLMPTVLEWWRERHGLLLLWGSTAYLFTLALAVYRWLNGSTRDG